jgi:hypothetical protein
MSRARNRPAGECVVEQATPSSTSIGGVAEHDRSGKFLGSAKKLIKSKKIN